STSNVSPTLRLGIRSRRWIAVMVVTGDNLPSHHLREPASARAVGALRQPTSALKLLPFAPAVHANHPAGVGGPGAIGALVCALVEDGRPFVAPPRSQMRAQRYDRPKRSKRRQDLFLRGNSACRSP